MSYSLLRRWFWRRGSLGVLGGSLHSRRRVAQHVWLKRGNLSMDVRPVGCRPRARILRRGVLCPGLLLLASAYGAAADAPAELTLEQAVAEAIAQNPSLAVERREIEIAKGTRRQAGIYPFNPELEGDGGAGRARDRLDADVRRGVDTRSFGVSQTIWLKGQRGLRVRSAEAGLVRAQSLVQDAERQVVADTLKAYSDLLVS